MLIAMGTGLQECPLQNENSLPQPSKEKEWLKV